MKKEKFEEIKHKLNKKMKGEKWGMKKEARRDAQSD